MKLCVLLLWAAVEAQQPNDRNSKNMQSQIYFGGDNERHNYDFNTLNNHHYIEDRNTQVSQPSPILLQAPYFEKNDKIAYDRLSGAALNRNINIIVNERNGQPVESRPSAPRENASLAVMSFGLILLQNIQEGHAEERNVVFSPFSIATLLALLQQGSLGGSQAQITAALGMSPDAAAEAFRQFNDNIYKRNSRSILKMATNVFAADAFELNPLFKRVASRDFGSQITPTSFYRSQDAVQMINNWVATNTNNNIREILTPDAVDQNTQLVLVNTVYFKGLWQVKFKPELTIPREFHLHMERSKMVPTMRLHTMLKTGLDKSTNSQVVILPFEGEQYSLLVILPPRLSSVRAVASSLSAAQLVEYFNFTQKEVNLELPKFTVRADTDLNPVFRKMGIQNIFGPKSELSGLGTYRSYSPQVSSAVHSAMVSVDEQGGTAAASTAFAAVALSYDDSGISFKVDRPFLAILWDHHTALPLFIASVQDPTI